MVLRLLFLFPLFPPIFATDLLMSLNSISFYPKLWPETPPHII